MMPLTNLERSLDNKELTNIEKLKDQAGNVTPSSFPKSNGIKSNENMPSSSSKKVKRSLKAIEMKVATFSDERISKAQLTFQ